jgi:hypothetical protein
MKKTLFFLALAVYFPLLGSMATSQEQNRKAPSMSQEGTRRNAEPWNDPDFFKPSKRKFKEGQRLAIDTLPQEKVLVAFANVRAISKFLNAGNVKDEYGFRELVDSGEVIVLERETKILVLELSNFILNPYDNSAFTDTAPIIKARILTGKHQGEAVYLVEALFMEKQN